MSTSAVDDQIEAQVARCRSPRHQRLIMDRWGRLHPAFNGLSIDEIHARCRRGTTAQNPLVGALIELHQAGDADASSVLLSLCKPIVHGLTRISTKAASRRTNPGFYTTVSDTYWAGLGHVLATIPSGTPTDPDGSEQVFLAYIGHLTSHRRRQHNASERRRLRFETKVHGERVVQLTDAILESHHVMQDVNRTPVEDSALRMIELNQIADVVRAGLIDADKWRQLLEHRVTTSPGSTGRDRVAAHRTARRLAELVDHAA